MSSYRMTRSTLPQVLAASILLAAVVVASPLLACALIAAPFCVEWVGRGLPAPERRALYVLLGGALLVRLALVAAQLIAGLPMLNDSAVGALAGDESYYLSRALRVRDLMAGYAATKYDYFVANDAYGQTSYLTVLTWLQVVFGPTPYSLKVVNGLLFVCGAGVLFRMARASFGPLPAFVGLSALLFWPSLLFSSVSLLKESMYFLASSIFAVASWWLIRSIAAGQWQRAAMLVPIGLGALLLLDGLRRGALILMAGGLLAGLAIWWFGQTRRRVVMAAAAGAVAVTAVIAVPAVHDRVLRAVESAAKIHAGHVFTVGHVYKLMDEGFYVRPHAPASWDLRLTDRQALQFVVKAAVSFAVTPWPWEMRSAGELALLPEHIVWCLMVGLLPFGIAAGWRRDPLATALWLGLAIPTAAAVALTNGNVGTLIRLRGLATPYLVWLGAFGCCVVGERLAASRLAGRGALIERQAL